MKFPYILFAIFVLVGLAIAVYGLTVLYHARHSGTWPSTEGFITQSNVVRGDDSYSPAVVYSYTVNGVRCQGKDIASGPVLASSTEAYARNCLARYPVGTPVAVYYDPEIPATAVLEPGILKKSFVPLAFGLLFVTLGGWFWVLWWLCDG